MKNTKNKEKDLPGLEKDLADNKADVTPEDIKLLERSENSMGGEEEENLEKARLDNVDEDGEELNEQIDFSGKDLDVPGTEDDDANEEIGEEDEENNNYSLGGDSKED